MNTTWVGALVLWLCDETHFLKVVGSLPSTIYLIYVFDIDFLSKLICFSENPKINVKETWDGTFFKIVHHTSNSNSTNTTHSNWIRPHERI